MWLLALTIFGLAKVVTWVSRPATTAPAWKHAGYVLAWPGMDVEAFLNVRYELNVTLIEWSFAIGKTIFGVILSFAAYSWLSEFGTLPVGLAGMVGIVFALHLGLFHILSCGWRAVGIKALPLMNWPIAATSLTDFWSNRWNRAFHDLTIRLLFRPLNRRVGASTALMASFVTSGIVHDLVISIPAGGGYGLPTLYFAIQGAAILSQRSRLGKELHIKSGVCARLFMVAVLVSPSPLLFHDWFIHRVIVPFLQALSVLS